ncbi:cytochrome b5 domain-containing protein [Thiococcus pfennigii]|uniref:cytochrome b5 domain-containing protein n=1 Tax=Thiococcus pfennigii TaxID=1057 RepID=UPI0019037608|nr:cytochrome b5-like heme/steroid binding domain-containing protein [Thiococcus pfennigii]MBK1732564.1 cytochrome B [Thiococcus pfennigii]
MRSTTIAIRSILPAALACAALLGAWTAAADEAPLPTYRLEDIAAHASQDDCWMAIDGQVYDVTEHIEIHPTQPELVATWCGKEASEGWHTKNYGQPHSPAAEAMLEEIRIGTLAE